MLIEGKEKKDKIKKYIKILGNVLTIAALVLVVYRLAHYNIDYASVFTGEKIILLVALILLFSIGLLLTPYSWTNLIHCIGYKQVRFRDVQTICIKSNLMKYIPGNVMQYVGRNEIAVMYDLSHGKIALTTILDISANVFGVGIVSLACYSNGLSTFFQNYQIPWDIVLLVGGLLLVGAVILVYIFRSKIRAAFSDVQWKKFIFSVLLYVFYGFFSGILYILTMKLIVGVEVTGGLFFTVVGAFLLSWLFGFITPGAPGGVGIREAAIVLLLNGFMLEEQILLGIVVYRVINTIGDVLAYGICLMRNQYIKKHQKIDQNQNKGLEKA